MYVRGLMSLYYHVFIPMQRVLLVPLPLISMSIEVKRAQLHDDTHIYLYLYIAQVYVTFSDSFCNVHMACMRVSLLFLSLETHVHTDITNRIVAMGYPSCGKEARYRNPLVDVQRFITQFHDGHYRIYNLCSEREYDVRRCTIIPRTHTHSPKCPKFTYLRETCLRVRTYTQRS